MDWIKRTYLYRVYSANKIAFGLLCCYMVATLYCALISHEEFPFLLYGMYSLKEEPQPTYQTYSIIMGNQEAKMMKLRDPAREIITSTMAHTIPAIESGQLDTSAALKYKAWLMDYALDMRMVGNNVMNVYRLTCSYDETGHPKILKRDLVYQYATE